MEMTKEQLFMKEALEFAPQSQTVRYVQFAAYSLMLYDWTLMFGQEVEYVWRRKMSAGTLIYVLNRYVAIAFQTFDIYTITRNISNVSYCHAYFWVIVAASTILLLNVQLTLQFRVHALYHCDRRILITNLVLFLITIMCTAGMVVLVGPNISGFPAPKPCTGCWAEVPKYSFVIIVPGLCFETWLCALVIRRAYIQSKSDKFIGRKRNILSLLVLDSVIWFGVIFVLIVWLSMGLILAPRGYNIIGISWYHTGVNVGGSRLILHMRRAYFHAQMKPVDPNAGFIGYALPLQPMTPSWKGASGSDLANMQDTSTDESPNVATSQLPDIESGETLTRFMSPLDMPRIDVNVQVEVQVQVAAACSPNPTSPCR